MSRCSCYVFTRTRAGIIPLRLSHSEIPGSKRVYRSPRLIAVSHVLHRLLAPRHPLCALCSLINLFRSLAGPEILLITETLGPGHLTFPVVFSDSALKVVLSYYPVCRFQRTSGAGTFRATKKLNLAPTIIHVSVHHAGTKLSSNLQSQNMQEPTLFVLRLRESRFRRGSQNSGEIAAVKRG